MLKRRRGKTKRKRHPRMQKDLGKRVPSKPLKRQEECQRKGNLRSSVRHPRNLQRIVQAPAGAKTRRKKRSAGGKRTKARMKRDTTQQEIETENAREHLPKTHTKDRKVIDRLSFIIKSHF